MTLGLSYEQVCANIADKSYPCEESIIRFALNGRWPEVHVQGLSPEDFRKPVCRKIYEWCLEHPEKAKADGFVGAYGEIPDPNVRQFIGSANIVERTPLTMQVSYFAKMLRTRSAIERRRNVLMQMSDMSEADPDAIMSVANQVIADAAQEKINSSDTTMVRDTVIRLFDAYEAASAAGAPKGAPTGIDSLDERLGHLRTGQFITIAARPGGGKSTFAPNVCLAAALDGFRTAYFSYEMGEQEILARMIARRTQINSKLLLPHFYPKLLETGKADYAHETAATIARLPMSIHDKAPKDWPSVAAEIQSLAVHEGLKVVIIDMISHLHPAKRIDNRTAELQEITAAAKQLAREANICVIGLTQIRRDNTGRNPMPQMDDIKQSGSFEEDSDVLLLLHRPGKSNKKASPNLYQINIAKQRQGATSVLDCYHDFETATVRDWHHHDGDRYIETDS